MIIIFGFRTPGVGEIPEILYIGDDGVKANEICETDPHPRIARMDNPMLRPYRHWTEEASQAFEKQFAEKGSHEIKGQAMVVPSDLLEALTIDELKEIGKAEKIDLSGCKLKQDYIDAILAARNVAGATHAAS